MGVSLKCWGRGGGQQQFAEQFTHYFLKGLKKLNLEKIRHLLKLYLQYSKHTFLNFKFDKRIIPEPKSLRHWKSKKS